ncbi:MAG: murein biosynthesis integral membrane protein MurJ [Fusobacteriaceae bacterium]
MFKKGIGMMLIIFLSRILGMLRGTVMAFYFGAGQFTDAYYSAFKFSNFFRQLLGEGALGNTFIPLYNDKLVAEGEKKSREFIFSILNLVFIVSTLITIGTYIFSDYIITYTVKGFDSDTKLLAIKMLRMMSSYFIFISLAGMLIAMLNNFRHFLIGATTGIIFNVVLIISIFFASKAQSEIILSYGVALSGAFQFIILLPSFLKIVKTYSFKINFDDPYLKKTMLMLLPMLVGIFARQVNVIVDQYFASYLGEGVVTGIENATRVYNLPIGVFGITIATITFPALAEAISKKEFKSVRANMTQGINILMFFVLPATAILTFYGRDVIKLIFGYGKFNQEAVKVTSEILVYYSIGLFFYTGIHLVTRGFYGMKDSKTPVKFSILAIMINILLNIILVKKIGYIGLALSTSVAAIINFSCLSIVFHKNYCTFEYKKILSFFIKVSLSIAISLVISYNFYNVFIKFGIFLAIYLAVWGYPLYKKGKNIFV